LLSFFLQNSVSLKLLYLILQTEIQRDVQCIPIHCPLISQDRMQQFITKAHLDWQPDHYSEFWR